MQLQPHVHFCVVITTVQLSSGPFLRHFMGGGVFLLHLGVLIVSCVSQIR